MRYCGECHWYLDLKEEDQLDHSNWKGHVLRIGICAKQAFPLRKPYFDIFKWNDDENCDRFKELEEDLKDE